MVLADKQTPRIREWPTRVTRIIAASVCIIDLMVLPARVGSDRFRLEIIPVVKVRSRPNGSNRKDSLSDL